MGPHMGLYLIETFPVGPLACNCAILAEAARIGVTHLGITDHLNTFDQLAYGFRLVAGRLEGSVKFKIHRGSTRIFRTGVLFYHIFSLFIFSCR